MAETARCACGDPRYLHRRTSMSVELPPDPNPIYPIPLYNPITNTYPGYSTYFMDECHCGCTMFEAL